MIVSLSGSRDSHGQWPIPVLPSILRRQTIFGYRKNVPVSVVERYIAALNACETETIDSLLADDVRCVDSSGGWLEGRENVVVAMRNFFESGIEFRIDDAEIVLHGDEVLVRGKAKARDPELATDKLWKAKVTNGKLSFWQGFGDKGVPFARMVSPEKVGIPFSMQPLFPSKSA